MSEMEDREKWIRYAQNKNLRYFVYKNPIESLIIFLGGSKKPMVFWDNWKRFLAVLIVSFMCLSVLCAFYLTVNSSIGLFLLTINFVCSLLLALLNLMQIRKIKSNLGLKTWADFLENKST